jgi:2,3-bisphosphoglycerate-independent phosphoglycerate mutase
MDKTEQAKISAKIVNEFVKKSHIVLDQHKVNKKRAAEGKMKANVILTRDGGHILPKFFDINEKYNVNFVSFAEMPVEKGISKLVGMHVTALPPPSNDKKKDYTLRVKKLLDQLSLYDCFYIHIKGPDEPGHDGDFNVKTDIISVIDKYFFGPLLERIRLKDWVICVTADHSTPCKLKAHSDSPVPLLISGNKIEGDNVSKFSEKECKKGSLGILEHGTELMPKLMGFLKT